MERECDCSLRSALGGERCGLRALEVGRRAIGVASVGTQWRRSPRFVDLVAPHQDRGEVLARLADSGLAGRVFSSEYAHRVRVGRFLISWNRCSTACPLSPPKPTLTLNLPCDPKGYASDTHLWDTWDVWDTWDNSTPYVLGNQGPVTRLRAWRVSARACFPATGGITYANPSNPANSAPSSRSSLSCLITAANGSNSAPLFARIVDRQWLGLLRGSHTPLSART